ncbi:MAG: 50S ribosomal protein L10 [Erysipelotrichaceae bacterium]|nr:50S ribosomal protein L10 [Erysipelotrichaceae bacterium]
MAKEKEVLVAKQAIIDEVTAKIENSASMVVAEYRGLTVAEVTELRKALRAEGVEMKVYKNKLVKRATAVTGKSDLDEYLTGPNAYAFGLNDAVAPARVLADFAKKHKQLILKAGIVEGDVVGSDDIKAIAKLPDRKGMYSMLLGCIQAPVSKFARAVKAVADAKAEASGEAPATTEDAAAAAA